MTDTTMTARSTSASVWIGRVLSGIVVVALLADGGVQLVAPGLMREIMEASAVPLNLSTALGTIILICTILYAIPQTAVLGAILVTGFLGGSIAIHFRLNEIGSPPQLISLLLGIMTWAGLYLRDSRLRALLPFTS